MTPEAYTFDHPQERRCFYCSRPALHFDRDHAPVPNRHGGTDLVDACTHCHDLKDRIGLDRWSPAEHAAVMEGATFDAILVISYCKAAMEGVDVVLDAATVLSAALTCTTPQARISVFLAFCMALDQTKGACLKAPGDQLDLFVKTDRPKRATGGTR